MRGPMSSSPQSRVAPIPWAMTTHGRPSGPSARQCTPEHVESPEAKATISSAMTSGGDNGLLGGAAGERHRSEGLRTAATRGLLSRR